MGNLKNNYAQQQYLFSIFFSTKVSAVVWYKRISHSTWVETNSSNFSLRYEWQHQFSRANQEGIAAFESFLVEWLPREIQIHLRRTVAQNSIQTIFQDNPCNSNRQLSCTHNHTSHLIRPNHGSPQPPEARNSHEVIRHIGCSNMVSHGNSYWFKLSHMRVKWPTWLLQRQNEIWLVDFFVYFRVTIWSF